MIVLWLISLTGFVVYLVDFWSMILFRTNVLPLGGLWQLPNSPKGRAGPVYECMHVFNVGLKKGFDGYFHLKKEV